jgi:hypothetical protein
MLTQYYCRARTPHHAAQNVPLATSTTPQKEDVKLVQLANSILPPAPLHASHARPTPSLRKVPRHARPANQAMAFRECVFSSSLADYPVS